MASHGNDVKVCTVILPNYFSTSIEDPKNETKYREIVEFSIFFFSRDFAFSQKLNFISLPLNLAHYSSFSWMVNGSVSFYGLRVKLLIE